MILNQARQTDGTRSADALVRLIAAERERKARTALASLSGEQVRVVRLKGRGELRLLAALDGDPRRLLVMGHSAGARIGAMLAFDRRWLAGVGLDAQRDLAGMIGLAGPYDFLPLRNGRLKEIFGPEPGLTATQPINFVDGDAPPALLVSGRRDGSVDPGNTKRMAARIRAAGGEAEAVLYRRVGHRTLVGALARPLRFLAPVLDDVVAPAMRPRRRGIVADPIA